MNRTERLENLSAYIDGELSEAQQRLLAAWCDDHPEDVAWYGETAQVVGLVRELPSCEPPANLRERILRAVRESAPVEANREQAETWLDRYFEHELPAPQVAVVEHYLAVDPEFAEMAQVHQAMMAALSDLGAVEPPSSLRERIRHSVPASDAPGHAATHRSTAPRRGRPRLSPATLRRRLATVGTLAAILLIGVFGVMSSLRNPGSSLSGEPSGPTIADSHTATPAGPTDPQLALEAPELPVDDGPVVATPMQPDGPGLTDSTPTEGARPPVYDTGRPGTGLASEAGRTPRQRRLPTASDSGAGRPRSAPARTGSSTGSTAPAAPPPLAEPRDPAETSSLDPRTDALGVDKAEPPARPAPLPLDNGGALIAGDSDEAVAPTPRTERDRPTF